MMSLTLDRCLEMARHHRFSVATVAVYFCDPQSPWQRGTNENTNGLHRQYFPERTDLARYTQRELNKIACKLNTRPPQDPRLSDTRCYTCRECCADELNPPSLVTNH